MRATAAPPLSAEQQEAVALALAGESFLITGGAGTGKSHTLKAVIAALKRARKCVAVVAPTGAAATLIDGVTIHSWAGIGVHDAAEMPRLKKWNVGNVVRTHVLVIDEISMVADHLFVFLDRICREAKKALERPFGGVQLVCCGDFFQLPPVKARFCFECPQWGAAVRRVVNLSHSYRQGSDYEFADILSRVRVGMPTQKDLATLASAKTASLPVEPTRLYPLRVATDAENATRLAQLEGAEHVYVASDEGRVEASPSWCTAPQRLALKLNAQVILLRNLEVEDGLVNGSRGVVVGFCARRNRLLNWIDDGAVLFEHCEDPRPRTGRLEPDVPIVQFANGREVEVPLCTWDSYTPEPECRFVGMRTQYPLLLGWAITVHKSQGMSLDRVDVHLAGCFERGMAYVALSRCRSLAGLHVTGLAKRCITTDPRAINFYATTANKRQKIV
jgi:ATP-dependent DNA helicase PIF1